MTVIVAGELPRERTTLLCTCSAPAPELVDFARGAYHQRSPWTSRVLGQRFEGFQGKGQLMPYTVEDFERDYIKKHFARLTPEDKREALQALSPEDKREALQALSPEEQHELLQALPPEKQRELLQALPPEQRLAGLLPEQRLAGLSAEQIQQYLERLTAHRPAKPHKPRPKKRSNVPEAVVSRSHGSALALQQRGKQRTPSLAGSVVLLRSDVLLYDANRPAATALLRRPHRQHGKSSHPP